MFYFGGDGSFQPGKTEMLLGLALGNNSGLRITFLVCDLDLENFIGLSFDTNSPLGYNLWGHFGDDFLR